MTFSLVGRCERTGAVGAVIASASMAVAARCPAARAGVGAVSPRRPAAAATAIGVMGCASLAITVALIPGLRRTRPRHGRYGSGTAPGAGTPAATPGDQRSATLPSRQ